MIDLLMKKSYFVLQRTPHSCQCSVCYPNMSTLCVLCSQHPPLRRASRLREEQGESATLCPRSAANTSDDPLTAAMTSVVSEHSRRQ